MKVDLYTKVVLTVIAVALWGIFLAPFFETREVGASTGVMDVNIKQIDGRRVKSVLLDVAHSGVLAPEVRQVRWQRTATSTAKGQNLLYFYLTTHVVWFST